MAAGVRRDHRRCEPAAGNVKYENEMESDLTHYSVDWKWRRANGKRFRKKNAMVNLLLKI